jgi:hypothetical protein
MILVLLLRLASPVRPAAERVSQEAGSATTSIYV